MNKPLAFILSLAAMLLTVGCGSSESEYSTVRCYLVLDNANHLDATLASAMNASAPGVFCKVSTTFSGGVNYYTFANNQGQQSQSIFDAEDSRRSLVIGLNNAVIVGYGSLSQPATFYAFDAECPNCFDPDALPVKTKPLQMTTSGMAVCNSCHRQYSLNNGGVISSGDGGHKLTRYRATSTGPYGVLSVQ